MPRKIVGFVKVLLNIVMIKIKYILNTIYLWNKKKKKEKKKKKQKRSEKSSGLSQEHFSCDQRPEAYLELSQHLW